MDSVPTWPGITNAPKTLANRQKSDTTADHRKMIFNFYFNSTNSHFTHTHTKLGYILALSTDMIKECTPYWCPPFRRVQRSLSASPLWCWSEVSPHIASWGPHWWVCCWWGWLGPWTCGSSLPAMAAPGLAHPEVFDLSDPLPVALTLCLWTRCKQCLWSDAFYCLWSVVHRSPENTRRCHAWTKRNRRHKCDFLHKTCAKSWSKCCMYASVRIQVRFPCSSNLK